MDRSVTARQLFLARAVVAISVIMVAIGLYRYGVSTEVLERIGRNIAERPRGPMTFRFVLQPIMAAIAAYRDGARDARLARLPYLWAVVTDRHGSIEHLREGVIATARILLLGLVMDVIYQIIVLDTLHPAESVLVAVLVAFLPYVLLRGPFCRLAEWRARRKSGDASR